MGAGTVRWIENGDRIAKNASYMAKQLPFLSHFDTLPP
jgi:hypothetical protein